MTVFLISFLVMIVGLVLALLNNSGKAEKLGYITFACGLWFVLWRLAAVAINAHWS